MSGKTLWQLFEAELEPEMRVAAGNLANAGKQNMIFMIQALRILWLIKSAVEEAGR